MKADLRPVPDSTPAVGMPRPSDRASIRRDNLGVVLRLLRDGGPRSRVRIAADTGLPKPTITGLVGELVALGLASEGTVERDGSIGRPGLSVHLDGRDVCGVGAEISADYVGVLAMTLRGETVFEQRVPVAVAAAEVGSVLDLLADLITRCLADIAGRGVRPAGITLAVPGVVNTAAGRVDYAANLGWRDVDVLAAVRRRLNPNAPELRLENDAKLAAVAEYLAINDAAVHDLLYVTGETGIGGGIISGGQLLRGAAGFAGEIGHMPLDPERRPCACGRLGCWETMVGLSALLRLAADPDDPVHNPTVDVEQRLAELKARALAGDERTLAAFDRVAADLGLGIGLLADVLNPRAVILGGYFTHVGELMLDRIRSVVRERVMAPDAGGCRVEVSRLGFSAPALGGAHSALERVYQDPAARP
ncbi:ROK family protein [Catenulispora sp. NF23]|uniref:ROK family protein n=1 Tax=Catenulispora pinistramenti TaxID=2705254 RepID=UPI001BA443AF|nr:ROK family protein [Catenulispora pinistramenti]MBS2534490.1 ROK family protein [Catenulispora pinistramenti]